MKKNQDIINVIIGGRHAGRENSILHKALELNKENAILKKALKFACKNTLCCTTCIYNIKQCKRNQCWTGIYKYLLEQAKKELKME